MINADLANGRPIIRGVFIGGVMRGIAFQSNQRMNFMSNRGGAAILAMVDGLWGRIYLNLLWDGLEWFGSGACIIRRVV